MQRRFLFVTLAVTAVILHGSLYPYDFHVPPDSAGPLMALVRSWGARPDSFGEMLANILLYVPFGLFTALAPRGVHSTTLLCRRFRVSNQIPEPRFPTAPSL